MFIYNLAYNKCQKRLLGKYPANGTQILTWKKVSRLTSLPLNYGDKKLEAKQNNPDHVQQVPLVLLDQEHVEYGNKRMQRKENPEHDGLNDVYAVIDQLDEVPVPDLESLFACQHFKGTCLKVHGVAGLGNDVEVVGARVDRWVVLILVYGHI